MPITFPRSMPARGVALQVFELQRMDFETGTTGGRTFAVTAGLPRWRAEWSLGQGISDVTSDEWRAFLASLGGSQRTFFGRDVERPFPRLYKAGFGGMNRAGGGAFDGTATSWSHSVNADGVGQLTLNGLPAGFQVSAGDYVGFRWTNGGAQRRALVRSLENLAASGAGVLSNLAIEPAVPALVPGAAVAHLDNPECVMRLVTEQTRVTEMGRRRVSGARIVALQELRA